MKKALLYLFILLLIIGVLGSHDTLLVQAATDSVGNTGNAAVAPPAGTVGGANPASTVAPAGTPAAAPAAAGTQSTGRQRGQEGWVDREINDAIIWILVGVLGLFGWLLGIMGWLLNLAMNNLVIGMGGLIRDGGFGASIDAIWKIFRDLVNLLFVFGLIYVGIMTIIEGSMHSLKKQLASIIVAALLVNFSLFFAKAVIDVSNIVATSVYQKMQTLNSFASGATVGISGVFMQRIGVADIMVNGNSAIMRRNLEGVMTAGSGVSYAVVYSVGGSLLMFFLAIAFGIGAFLLIIRFITLIILMMSAPIGFLPKELPYVGQYREQWWSTLLNQAFLAPIFFFGLYIVLIILQGTNYGQTSAGLGGLFNSTSLGSSNNALTRLMYYLIAIFLILGVTAMAKKMSRAGASRTNEMMKWAGKGIGASLSVGGWYGRGIGGRIGSNIAKIESLKTAGKSSNFLVRNLAKGALTTARKAQKGTWDARNIKAVGGIAKQMDLDLGKGAGKDVNYKKWIEKKEHDEEEYAKSLNVKASDEEKNKQQAVIDKEKEVLDEEQKILKNENEVLKGMKETLERAKRRGVSAGAITKLEENVAKQQSKVALQTRVTNVQKNTVEGAEKKLFNLDKRNQIAYAHTLEKPSYLQAIFGGMVLGRTQGEYAAIGHHIIDNLEKDRKKTPQDRMIDGLKKVAEKVAHGGGGHDDAAHAPAEHAAPASKPAAPAAPAAPH